MNKFNAIKTEYNKFNFNNLISKIHSIDKDIYKRTCKDFFSSKSNKKLLLNISENAIFANNESEDVFIDWLLGD